jgi:maleylacetate reductase
MEPVSYTLRPGRIVFGAGALECLPRELDHLRLGRVFLLTTSGRTEAADRVAALLGPRLAGRDARAEPHVPAALVRAVAPIVRASAAECLVTVGGGSAVGLGKAVAREHGLPLVAVPTTYAGSEMTDIWGITDDGQKHTGRDPRVLPALVVYDPALTLTLPALASGASGLNAAAHAVEAIYAADANPVATLYAREALGLLSSSLPRIAARLDDRPAREAALRGAHLAGLALAMTTMGLHHRISHALGGIAGLPHALTHAVLLPFVAAFNRAGAPDAMRTIAEAIGSHDAAGGLRQLARTLGIPDSLAAIGMREAQIDAVASQVAARPLTHPRAAGKDDVRAILRAAFEGSDDALSVRP